MPIAIFCFNRSVHACDACGSAMSSGQMGILPLFYKHHVGVQRASRSFATYHEQGNAKVLHSRERFQSAEIRGRYTINQRWQVLAWLPFSSNQQTTNEVTTAYKGVGDLSAIVLHRLLNKTKNQWKHLLQGGVGLKLPTGAYKQLDSNLVLNPQMQVGSGSLDFLHSYNYLVRHNRLGLSAALATRWNTANNRSYRFGHSGSLGALFFYEMKRKNVIALPQIGPIIEYKTSDQHGIVTIEDAKAKTIQWHLGIDAYGKKISIQANFQIPIFQSNTLIQTQPRINVATFYNF